MKRNLKPEFALEILFQTVRKNLLILIDSKLKVTLKYKYWWISILYLLHSKAFICRIFYSLLTLVLFGVQMILTFGNKTTQKIWEGFPVRGVSEEFQEIIRRKLRMLNNSVDLNDLMVPPSNRLEKLKGKMKEYYSIRVNDQWRIIFIWSKGHALEVELRDYH